MSSVSRRCSRQRSLNTAELHGGLRAPTTALYVCAPWIHLILDGLKTWEIRSRPCKKRGRVALALPKSSTVIGDVLIVDCVEIYRSDFTAHEDKHCVTAKDATSVLKDCDCIYAWHLAKPRRYASPVAFRLKPGQVVWIDLRDQQHELQLAVIAPES